MGEQKFFGTRIRRKEILSPELFDIVQNSIPARQKTAGVGMFPGEATESVRIGKHRLFNKETYVYVDNMGFFPNVWITDKKGEQIAKSIIAELEKRKMKPRLHRNAFSTSGSSLRKPNRESESSEARMSVHQKG